ncbi:MAG: potassium/proton antiporter [Ignavibacteria bacterium]|nr:potassium/proton antiporter [Ignavibacteria bacterium]
MVPFEYILLVISVLVLISISLTKVSENLGVPSLILFLIVGMLAGSDGFGKIYFDNVYIAQYVGIVALIFILFSGGLDTKWYEVKPVLKPAFFLSTIGVFIAAVVMGYVIHFLTGLSITEGLLIGAIISSTDAAAVFSVLSGKSINLKNNIKPLLVFESGSNDPAAIILTVLFIQFLQGDEVTALRVVLFLFLQIGLGSIIGLASGKLLAYSFNKFRFPFPSLYPVFAIASAVLIYAAAASVESSGILAVYIASVILGNSDFVQKKSTIRFFDSLALFGQIIMFLTLGLLVYPAQLYNVIGVGLILSAALILLARPISVFISMIGSKFKFNDKLFISWVGLKGAVPIILATFPLTAGLSIGPYIFTLVFFITITSALVQGWSIPLAAKLLGVKSDKKEIAGIPIEINENVNTKNDLLDLIISERSWAAGKTLAELHLPAESLITVIYRDDDYVVPSGSTQLEAGDTILVLVNKDNLENVKSIFNRMI